MAAENTFARFEPFWKLRWHQNEWRRTLEEEIARRTGRRRRWDVPLGVAIENGKNRQKNDIKPHLQTTDQETKDRLRQIIGEINS